MVISRYRVKTWTLENGVSSGEIGKQSRKPETFAPCYGDDAIGESTARKWFSRFKEDRFYISDIPCSGRPSGFDEDRLNTLFHNDPRQRT